MSNLKSSKEVWITFFSHPGMGFRFANSVGSCTSGTEDCIRSMADGREEAESTTPPTAKEDGMSGVAVRRGGAELDKGAGPSNRPIKSSLNIPGKRHKKTQATAVHVISPPNLAV